MLRERSVRVGRVREQPLVLQDVYDGQRMRLEQRGRSQRLRHGLDGPDGLLPRMREGQLRRVLRADMPDGRGRFRVLAVRSRGGGAAAAADPAFWLP